MFRALQASIAFRLGLTKLPYPPLLVSLEPTNFCNLRCPMCPVGHHSKDKTVARGFMPGDVFDALLPELARLRPEIAFHMGGESLLHPAFFRMGRRLREAGLKVRLDSNAILICDEVARRLVDEIPVDEIFLDLDGEDCQSYEQIRRRAKFARVVSNIQNLLEVRAERGSKVPRITVKGIRYYRPGAKPGFPEAYKAFFALTPPDAYRFAWADYWPGSHRDDIEGLDADAQYTAPSADGEPSRCELLWTRLAIAWDGRALLCCLDLNRKTNMADVIKTGVMGAWNAQPLIEARRLHVAGRQHVMPLCDTCQQIRRPEQTPRWRIALLNASRDAHQGGERES